MIGVYSKNIKVELKLSHALGSVEVTTYSLWEIGKQHFLMIDTLWLKIKQQWMKVMIALNPTAQMMDISEFRLDLGSRNQI